MENINEIAKRLRELRLSKNLEQTDVADYLGYKSFTTISKWENGKNLPTGGKLAKLAILFNTTTDYILYGEQPTSTTQPTVDALPQAPDELVTAINDKVVQLTTPNKKTVLATATELLDAQNTETDIEEELYTYRVYERLSAGTGTGYYEDGDYDTVYYDEDLTHDLASWIYGDSMEPTYLNGEVALIKADGFDYDGAVYAVSWAGQTFIKKVYLEEDGYRLVSLNQKYAPLFAHKDEDPRIIGRVVGNFKPMER